MKLLKIICMLSLGLFFVPAVAQGVADLQGGERELVVYQGVVDELYLVDSQVVVGDVVLYFNTATRFFDIKGRRTSALKKLLAVGVLVKAIYYEQSDKLILKDMQVISIREFEKMQQGDQY